MLRSCSSVRMYPEQGRVRISVNNLIRGNAAETESNQIGLRSVRKMVEMHQGELYTFVETNIYTVQIIIVYICRNKYIYSSDYI